MNTMLDMLVVCLCVYVCVSIETEEIIAAFYIALMSFIAFECIQSILRTCIAYIDTQFKHCIHIVLNFPQLSIYGFLQAIQPNVMVCWFDVSANTL